jgi:hypothetical protein
MDLFSIHRMFYTHWLFFSHSKSAKVFTHTCAARESVGHAMLGSGCNGNRIEDGMAGHDRWYREIRGIHDGHFHDPWEARADAINQHLGLLPVHALRTPGEGVPPPWFIGDVDAVSPGRWALTISLNHQARPDAHETLDHFAGAPITPASYWDYCREFNIRHCYRPFFGPLANVAAAGLEEQLTRCDACVFATNRMIFAEICPYGSNRFSLGWPAIEELLRSDLGFQLASRVNHLLVTSGQSGLVMVNGTKAITMFEHLYAGGINWRVLRYDSVDLPRDGRKRKRLWHRYGSLHLEGRIVPVVGFPFLRTPRTHNSAAELEQLGGYVRQCVDDEAARLHGDSVVAR